MEACEKHPLISSYNSRGIELCPEQRMPTEEAGRLRWAKAIRPVPGRSALSAPQVNPPELQPPGVSKEASGRRDPQ